MITLKWAALALAGLAVLASAGLAAAIAFGTAPAPEPLDSISGPLAKVDYRDLPLRQHFQARDGTTLAYRVYQADGDRVVVLIHGSSGESTGMHALADGLNDAGFNVYVPDLRGHANDGRLGDIDYLGQLDDDLVDFMQVVRQEHPHADVALAGHSSGGGFVLRIAEGPQSSLFARYVLLSPALHYGAPTWRPDAGGWAAPFVPRIISLTLLDRLGITWFQHLTAVAFAVPHDVPVRLAPGYTFVMTRNFGAPPDDLARFGQIRAPVALLVGDRDEVFYPDRFVSLLRPLRPATRFQVVPGVDHMGLIVQPQAIEAVLAALQASPGP
jgi:alpha-beta hydrolase superfamily lysophospholipase